MLGISQLLLGALVAAVPAGEPSSGLVIDGLLLHGTRNGRIVALRLDDGREVWRADLGTEPIHPVAKLGNVVLAREELGAVIGFDLKTKTRLWRTTPTVPELPTAPFPMTRNRYWVQSREGRLIAYDPRTGRAVQQSELLPSAVMIGDGRASLLAAGLDRWVSVRENGRLEWSKPLPERRASALSEHDGLLTMITEAKPKGRAPAKRTIRAFTSSTGVALWSWPADLDVERVASCRDAVVILGHGKAVKKKAPPPFAIGLDPRTGRPRWRRAIEVEDEVSCAAGHILLLRRDPTAGSFSVSVLDPATGLERWERSCERGLVAASKLRLYLKSASGRVLAVDAIDGAQRWAGEPDIIVTPSKIDSQRHRRYVSCGGSLWPSKAGRGFSPLKLSAEHRGREISVSRWLIDESFGSGLPPGLSLSRDGTLFGRPRRSGVYAFRLTAVGPELGGITPKLEIRIEP